MAAPGEDCNDKPLPPPPPPPPAASPPPPPPFGAGDWSMLSRNWHRNLLKGDAFDLFVGICRPRLSCEDPRECIHGTPGKMWLGRNKRKKPFG
jgi:hypothetical protein